MNTIFNINRVGLLLNRYFVENAKRELVYWGVISICIMFLRNNAFLMLGLLVVAGAMFAARFFKEIHSPTNGINYYMIPATQIEKTFVAVLMSIVYYFAMFILSYVLGNLLGTFLNNILASVGTFFASLGIWFSHKDLEWILFTKTVNMPSMENMGMIAKNTLGLWIPQFISIQSIFLLAGIYFKKNPVPKALLTIFLVLVVLVFIEAFMLKYMIGETSFNASMFADTESFDNAANIYMWIVKILGYLFIPFLWIISYFRLTEKQV